MFSLSHPDVRYGFDSADSVRDNCIVGEGNSSGGMSGSPVFFRHIIIGIHVASSKTEHQKTVEVGGKSVEKTVKYTRIIPFTKEKVDFMQRVMGEDFIKDNFVDTLD